MSQLKPLFDALRKTRAEQICLVPGERVHIILRGARQDIGREPINPQVILAAAGELLPSEDLRALTASRPRTVRHDHEGTAYAIELSITAGALAMTIRAAGAAPPPSSPQLPESSPQVGRAASLGAEAPSQARGANLAAEAPSQPRVAPPGASGEIELDVAPRYERAPAPALEVESPRAASPVRAPDPVPLAAAAPATSARPAAASAPGDKRIDGILRDMIAREASDLHLSADNCPVMRIHGEIQFLRELGVMSGETIFGLLREIMTEKAEKDFEKLRDADFAHEVKGLARFRVNAFEDRRGVGAVFRQIPIEIIPADKLGLPQAALDLCYLSKGLVVVTGPTGSGKSTTLAAMVDYINKNRSDHIITIEDPVEFVHPNIKCLVNQREVGQNTMSFKNALRAALREDPDIVLVGEMRDLETISIAIETAETGHLVFGTLHTTTAVSTVDRIIDQFPTDRQEQIRVMLSESLKGVIAQVLCKKIGGGRAAAQEILIGSSAVAALIRDGKTFQLPSVMQTSKNVGMVTMNDALFQLVQKKLVEPKEAYIKAVDKNGLLGMFKNAGLPTSFT